MLTGQTSRKPFALRFVLLLVRLTLVLLLALSTVTAQAADRSGWHADLEALVQQVQRVHPLARQCGLPPAVEKERAALTEELDELSDPQVVVRMQRMLAAFGDGHTLIWPFGMTRGALVRAPLSLWWFDEGLYVTDAVRRELVGKRIVSIGGLPVEEVLARLKPYISCDNDMQFRWAAPLYATFPDFLVAVRAARARDEIELTFADGSAATVRSIPIVPDELQVKLVAPRRYGPSYPTPVDTPVIDDSKADVLYVRLSAMSDAKAESLAAFGRRLRQKLTGRKYLLLDLRTNNGGETSLADELLRTVIAFDVSGGRTATLIGRMTFSAAETFAARLDQWTGTIFVGEPTGSKPNHYGNERPFKLAGSGLRGSIASGLNQPVTARDERTTISPDVAVPALASDYFAGRDPAIAAALDALRR